MDVVTLYLKHVLPIIAVLVVMAYAALAARTGRAARASRIVLGLVLAGSAALAVGNYADFGKWRGGSYLNAWEFFHYYLGSKYVNEVGYTGLYEAALVADDETGLKFRHEKGTIRNQYLAARSD